MNANTTVTSPVNEVRSYQTAPVWVQCPGFRCLAYQDVTGKWRTFFKGDILSHAVQMSDAMTTIAT